MEARHHVSLRGRTIDTKIRLISQGLRLPFHHFLCADHLHVLASLRWSEILADFSAISPVIIESEHRFEARSKHLPTPGTSYQHRNVCLPPLEKPAIQATIDIHCYTTTRCPPKLWVYHIRYQSVLLLCGASLPNDSFSIAASIILCPLIIEVVQITKFRRPVFEGSVSCSVLQLLMGTQNHIPSSLFAMNRSAAISVKLIPPTNTTNTVFLSPLPDKSALAFTALSSPF